MDKQIVLGKLCVVGFLLAMCMGCETGNVKKNSLSANGGKTSSQTDNFDGVAFSDYIFSHKNAKLKVSDCLMYSGKDWDRLYNDLIYVIAPAEPMAKSALACSGVMYGVEYGYLLERMSHGPIEYGFLKDDLKDISDISYPLYRYISQSEREDATITQINQMTLSECRQKYGQFKTKNQITMEMLDAMTKQSEAQSQKEVDELELYIAELSHCDDMMFDK